MRIAMFRPESGEETRGLLAETWSAILLDSRAAEVACSQANQEEIEPDRSPAENAIRIWHQLIPDSRSEWLEMRVQYGWTRDEVRCVANLISRVYNEFLRLSADEGTWAATRISLKRQAENICALYERWLDFIGEVGSPGADTA